MNNSWRNSLEHWPGSLPTIEVDNSKAALIMIDMQNYYIHEDGEFRKMMTKSYPEMEGYFMREIIENVIPGQKKLLDYFRKQELPIYHVRVGALLPNGMDQFKRRRLRDERRASMVGKNDMALVKGTFQHNIIDELAPLENEFILDKNSSSAFNSTVIDQLLRNTGTEFLAIGGILTNNCVEATARDAADKGFNVTLIEDGCATLTEETHYATYKTFSRAYGKVETANSILKKLLESKELNKTVTW
jgi:nicotinamidase-related amidase